MQISAKLTNIINKDEVGKFDLNCNKLQQSDTNAIGKQHCLMHLLNILLRCTINAVKGQYCTMMATLLNI